MFSSFDKAIVAAFGALAYIANAFLGIDFGVSPETFGGIIAAITPILVYLVPNKPWTA